MAPEARLTVAVAFSGGRDSLALLHATCRSAAAPGAGRGGAACASRPAARGRWLAARGATAVRTLAAGWLPLRLRWQRLSGAPAAGDSVEAWPVPGATRRWRRWPARRAPGWCCWLSIGRDQAETVLLQALRGGGPAGLSAMPGADPARRMVWARPWLDQPREAIEAYFAPPSAAADRGSVEQR